jgi:hypothetical protein
VLERSMRQPGVALSKSQGRARGRGAVDVFRAREGGKLQR